MEHDVKDLRLAEKGRRRIEWARSSMPVLRLIEDRFAREQPLRGIRVSACLHVTSETANLMRALKAGGAEVRLCASNPLSTQDDVAASLVQDFGVPVFAIRGEDKDTYYKHIHAALDAQPHLTMDDGADTIGVIHSERQDLAGNVIAGTEETTTGVIRLKSMERDGVLLYPIVAVNDANTKHFFDNRYGTGQSTLDGILRATNLLLAGKRFVVCGYGWCGRGVAMRAAAMGARVLVVEIDPHRAFEALMDGYEVAGMAEAASRGDIFLTLTGNTKVIRKEHFEKMKDGVLLGNAGHFDVEISKPDLDSLTESVEETRPGIRTYVLKDGRRLHLLGEGRLVNLACADGHPIEIMDLSFALQLESAIYMAKNSMKPGMYDVPAEIDRSVMEAKLASMNITLDTMTPEQEAYMKSWVE